MEDNKKSFSKSGDEDGCTQMVLFTAGTALAAVCLKRAAVAVFLIRQWRLWVFLVMNLLLLAILFTSALSSSPRRPSQGRKGGSAISVRIEGRKKKKKDTGFAASAPPLRHICEAEEVRKDSGVTKGAPRAEPAEECELSDDELNERVESFIASFRQQLVSDAREFEGGSVRLNSQLIPS